MTAQHMGLFSISEQNTAQHTLLEDARFEGDESEVSKVRNMFC